MTTTTSVQGFGLRGVVEATFISLLKSDQDSNGNFTVIKEDEIFLTEKYLENFNITIPGALAASQFEFTLTDPLWEFIDRLNLQDLNNTRFLKVRFRFGWNNTVYGRGIAGDDMTDWMIGSIITHAPNYSNGPTTVVLKGVGVQLEKDLLYIDMTVGIKATNKRDLYAEISQVYNLDIEIKGGLLDAEDIKSQIPLKTRTQTPLDYLASVIFPMFPPTIGGKPCFARFNPYQNSFILEPLDTANIATTYDYGIVGSPVKAYNPSVNPWLQLKATKPITSSGITPDKNEEALGVRTMETIDYASNDPSIENKTSKIRTRQENHLQKAVQASLDILGDVGATPHSYVLVNTYHPVTGYVHSSTAFFVKNVTHTVSSDFTTSLELVMAPQLVSDRTREVTKELLGYNPIKKVVELNPPNIVQQQNILDDISIIQKVDLGGLLEETPDSNIKEFIQQNIPGKNR